MRWLLWLYPRAWRRRYAEEFLALLETEPPSAWLLLDVVLGAVDAWLRPQVRPAVPATVASGRAGPYDRFTRRSRNVLQSAAEEAGNLHHQHIDTEHLLLGLLHEPDGLAMLVLRDLHVTPAEIRAAIQARGVHDAEGAPAAVGLSPQAKKAIHLSVEEAQRMRHRYVGTEHLLLGLIREGDGVAAAVLEQLSRTDLAEFRRRIGQALENR